MKKALSLLLAAVMCVGMAAVAFAASTPLVGEDNIPDLIFYVQVKDSNGDPLEADDLKASIEWDDGKEYFDKVKLSNSRDEVATVVDKKAKYVLKATLADSDKVANDGDELDIGGIKYAIADATTNNTIAKQLTAWAVAFNADTTYNATWKATESATGMTIGAKDNGPKTLDALTADAWTFTAGSSAAAGRVADTVKVKIQFKEYYGTDDIDIGGTLSLKKGSSKKAMTKLYDENNNDLTSSLSTDKKEYKFSMNYEWGTIAEQTDKDDDTVTVDFDNGIVIFDDDAAKFTTFEFNGIDELSVAGKMSKQDTVNMLCDTAVTDEIKAIMKKNEKVDFDVVNFCGKPSFDFTQEVSYDIDDEDVTYYVYEIKDGKAVEVNAKLNDDKDALIWKTRVLGCYIVTDEKIDASAAADDDKTEDGDKENPETGASDFVGVAVALGTVSLVAAGAVALKK